MRISFLGAGHLATQLGLALKAAGHAFVQVYSRTQASAEALAQQLGAEAVVLPEELHAGADLYLCALKDDALAEVLARTRLGDALLVHTAGSLPLEVLKPFAARYGVLYPLQTFNKHRSVDFSGLTLFLEASDETVLTQLRALALGLGSSVQEINSEERLRLHLSAVFACNFVNYLYSVADDLLAEQALSFEVLRPLILETAAKVQDRAPASVQTGPAVRFDQAVMDKHLALLQGHPAWKSLYEQLSLGIHQRTNNQPL